MNSKRWYPTAVTLAAALLGAAAPLQAQGNSDGPLVQTSDGPVRGFVSNGVYQFLGIPYAAPPVGARRWMPPQPHAAWTQPLNATAFAPTCAQITTLGVFAGPANNNEDCLFLNVFTPKLGQGEKRPVLVWIHGGGFVDGESTDYDGSKLAQQGPTVVVTINYRLGLLGYFGHPALDAEGHPFGNYGLMDQQAALRWVRRNIAAFGGDPNNVALGGQSAGSAAAYANMISPASAGLFHRAIGESGPLLTVLSRATAETRGTNFAIAAGCGAGADAATAACLRALPAAQIMALQGTASANGPYVTGQFVDGTLIAMPADVAFATGQFNRMPVINGTVEDEGNFGIGITQYFSGVPLTAAQYVINVTNIYSGNAGPGGTPPAYPPGTVDAVLAHYPLSAYATPQLAYDAVTTHPSACRARHLNQLLAPWVPVYAYEFTDRNAPYYFPVMSGFIPLAAHTIDIQFLFPLWHGGPLGIPHPLTRPEEHLSDQLVAAWTNFARTGNPNGVADHPWPRYVADLDNYLVQDVPQLSTFTGSEFSANHQCDFWDSVLLY